MANIPWHDLVTSRLFRFTVGPDKKEFVVHSAVVARQSRALDALVNGHFSEARASHAVLEAVDAATFSRFTQYAYTGGYKVRDTGSSNCPPECRPGRASPPVTAETHRHHRYDPSPAATNSNRLWAEFLRTANRFGADGFWTKKRAEAAVGLSAREVAEMVFLPHARLYVFADCYGVGELMDLAWNRLGRKLIGFELDGRSRIDGVVEVLRFCYDTPVPEELQAFVVLYAAAWADVLWLSPVFQELVLGNCELAKALLGKVLERDWDDFAKLPAKKRKWNENPYSR